MSYATGLRNRQGLRLPDFLGLGPGQTGSSWLYTQLARHPDVFVPDTKELNYFSQHMGDWSQKHYSRLFREAGNSVCGEISPGYSILRRDRIRYVRRIMPEAKLIIVIRNPIERSWSSIRRVLAKLNTDATSIDQNLLFEMLEDEWMYTADPLLTVQGDYESGLLEGFYCRAIENWCSVFNEEQLLVVYFDELVNAPKDFLSTVCRHIGVSPNMYQDDEELRTRVNPNPGSAMPDHVRSFLTTKYGSEIKRIRQRFGGASVDWKM